MLTRTVFFILTAHLVNSCEKVSAEEVHCDGLNSTLFENIMVDSFIDKNRYIRMNISWKNPTASFDTFEIVIDSESCPAVYGEQNLTVAGKYLILPSIERLMHPAEPLQHGCLYEFDFTSDIYISNGLCQMNQRINYTIPECVEDVCICSVENYSFQYAKYELVRDNIYKIYFNRNDTSPSINIEEAFDKIWYTNTNSNKTISIVREGQISFNNKDSSLTLPFNEFQSGNSYSINIDLLEDYCEYNYLFQIKVPASQTWVYNVVVYLCAVVLISAFLVLLLYRVAPQFFSKLKKHILPAQESLAVAYSVDPSAHIIAKTTKEIVNLQYTPLEFIMNCHNYDEFEHPRNKIIIRGEIGGGSFGKVYKADIHDLNNMTGFTVAAVKKPLDNAPDDEISDFLSEIQTMKKIVKYGGHPNVVRLLACVSIDEPNMMVMELVPCGDLKSYLHSLRKKWEEKKKEQQNKTKNRHFFPDNMILENYIPTVTISDEHEVDRVKYSDLTFDNLNGESHDSDDTSSYILPDSPITPSSTSSTSIATTQSTFSKVGSWKVRHSRRSQRMMPNYSLENPPITPSSITSSGIPSVTETLLTPLESMPATPLIQLSEEEKVKPVLDSSDLHNFALQIANGMAFLESIHITHRDLAARNILMSSKKILKISDFGMARAGVYVNTAQKRQPLRWMAPEAIENRRCDSKTDVWSFGVVLWEIGSLGAFPYKNLSNELVIAHIFRGERLQRPETCTDELDELMQRCWRSNPDERPTFEQIAKKLDSESGKVYVEFNKISPKYVFPPVQQEND